MNFLEILEEEQEKLREVVEANSPLPIEVLEEGFYTDQAKLLLAGAAAWMGRVGGVAAGGYGGWVGGTIGGTFLMDLLIKNTVTTGWLASTLGVTATPFAFLLGGLAGGLAGTIWGRAVAVEVIELIKRRAKAPLSNAEEKRFRRLVEQGDRRLKKLVDELYGKDGQINIWVGDRNQVRV